VRRESTIVEAREARLSVRGDAQRRFKQADGLRLCGTVEIVLVATDTSVVVQLGDFSPKTVRLGRPLYRLSPWQMSCILF
jgi:hypothetical protein